MTTKIERTGQLNAVDADGNRYTIIKYTEFYLEQHLDGSVKKLPGFDSYELPNGEPVNRISDNEFHALVSDVKLLVK